MSLFEIKNRWNGSILFSLECESMKLCVEAAVKARVSLRYSDLSYSNLSGSNLSYSDLSGSDLSGSDLSGSNLGGSNLSYSDLSGSDLGGSNLGGSDLRYSNLSGSNLSYDQLVWFRDDIWAVLSSSPAEVPALREALASGQVDGSTYSGDCCCLVGTLAKNRHCEYDAIPGLTPDSSRPAEQWFFGINKGDTPESSRSSKFALEWVDQWMGNMRAAFGEEISGDTK